MSNRVLVAQDNEDAGSPSDGVEIVDESTGIDDAATEEASTQRAETSDSDAVEALQTEVEDLSAGVSKLRRNADEYDAEEFARRAKALRSQADDLSSQATEAGADDTGVALDDAASVLGRVSREAEFEPREYYRERNYEISHKLRGSESSVDDAASALDSEDE
jgi:hypothetical protein